MSSNALQNIKQVDIDSEGTFKYILLSLYGDTTETQRDPPRIIVRGYKSCPYHINIYEEVMAKELAPQKLEAECLGGGRIHHDPTEKKIKVYGYSKDLGKADHTITVELLKNVYKDYTITYSDSGY